MTGIETQVLDIVGNERQQELQADVADYMTWCLYFTSGQALWNGTA